MSDKSSFYWKKVRNSVSGVEMVILGYNGDDTEGMEAWISPESGSNLCRLSVGGNNIIDFQPELLLNHDYTGTPVLYPTPNRVRNAMFVYKGMIYNQIKRGEPVFEHGLVHSEPWDYSKPVVKGDSIAMETWIEFNEESSLFEAFPFKHILTLEFCLKKDGINITYSIKNLDNKEIPYGIGLHPYFMKLSGENDTYIRLPADYLMDYTSDLLPTGRLIDLEDTIYDIRKPVRIGDLDLDHVFTGISKEGFAEVEYRTLGLKVTLEATPDFSHLVVYSPRGEKYFCIENQTCSTDAHNLYDRGFVTESGLKRVPPYETRSGYVKYVVRREVV